MTVNRGDNGEDIKSFSLKDIIAELVNKDKPLRNSTLVQLSDLDAEQIALFEQAWQKIGLQRRRKIINRLIEMSEDNPELNFDRIFLLCLKDSDAGVRSKAIEGLWENEDPSLIDSLVRLLNEDSSQAVQASAALSLGKFAILAELGKLRPRRVKQVVDSLAAVLNDKNRTTDVRRRALEAAGPLSLPHLEDIIREAYGSENPKLKASAIHAMGKSCNPQWLSELLNELRSEDSELRYEAAGACGQIGEQEAVLHLTRLVSDPDVDVQLAAIQALSNIGGNEAKKCLKQCAVSSSSIVKEAAIQCLQQLEAEEEPLFFHIGK